MKELKPCPFCGGKASLIKALLGVANHVSCDTCNARTEIYSAEAEAIKAWNTRAERTCMMDRDEYGYWVCSECGETLPAWVDEYPANYCPYCGAKVADDE